MNALFLRDHGQPQYAMLQGSVRAPERAAAGQLLVRACAVGVSQNDLLALETPFDEAGTPEVPGRELAGKVISVGAGVEGFSPGDRVAAIASSSAWAEQVLVDASCAIRLPDHVSFEEGSVLLGAVIVAAGAVKAAKLAEGETVVVTGATTAVGSALVQIARRVAGAKVIAVVFGEADENIAEKLQAELVVNRENIDLQDALDGNTVRVAFDTNGASHRLGHVISRGGRILRAGEVGVSDKRKAQRRAEQLAMLCKRKGACALQVELNANGGTVAEAARLIRDGVRVAHGPLFGVKEYLKAICVAEEGAMSGKVVLLM